MTELEKKEWLTKVKSMEFLPTPYVLTDLNIAVEKVKKLKSLLPEVEIFYAVKSNNHPKLIKKIDKLVDGYDIASLGELEALRKLRVKSDRILYSNPVKVPQHIQETYHEGVRFFALDSLDEIKKISKLAPGVNVYLRVQVSDYGSKFPLSKKFGLLPSHVADYATIAREAGLNVCGLAFHIGSQSENPQVWETAFETCGDLIKRLAEVGVNIEFIDMGGGFPADYGQPIPSIVQTCRYIKKAIKKHIPKGVRIKAEPGRYISANASVIATSVIAREHRSGTDWLYLDMGVFQGLMEPLEMRNWKYPVLTDKNPKGYKKEFALTGPTCDAFDTIGPDYLLPSDLNVGDKIYIAAAGAYSTVYGSSFNGFEMPKNYFVNDNRPQPIKG